jgi:hypothetical protein
MDESREEDDEEMDESHEDLEDSYMMDDEETGDETDDFGGEISADGDNFDAPSDDEHDHEGQEDSAIMDIKNAIQELEAAFAELEAAQGDEEAEMGMDSEFGDEEDEDEGMGFMEGRRMTREYVEKVGHNYGSSQTTDGDYAGAGTGEKQSKPVAGKSPVNANDPKRPSGGKVDGLKNILHDEEKHSEDGTKPHGKAVGLGATKAGGEFTGSEWKKNSTPGANAGKTAFKTKVSGAHGLAGDTRNNGSEGAPVGAGKGDKAGQTGGKTDTRSIESGNGR